jgi:hypothetical protein
VNVLHNQGIYSVKDATIKILDRTGRSEWKTTDILEIEGEREDRWGDFVASVKVNFYFFAGGQGRHFFSGQAMTKEEYILLSWDTECRQRKISLMRGNCGGVSFGPKRPLSDNKFSFGW